MSGIGFSNHDLVARSLDANKDNKIDKNEVSNIDRLNGQESVTTSELASALKADKVMIKNGMLAPGESININVKGLNVLKQINSDASQYKPYASPVWNRYSLEGSEGLRDVQRSSYDYASAIRYLKTDLQRISVQADYSGMNDPITNNVRSQANSALNRDRQLGYDNLLIDILGAGGVADWVFNAPSVFDDPFSNPKYTKDANGNEVKNPNWQDPYGPHIDAALAKNRNLEESYVILKNALYEIKDVTSPEKLPDIKANIMATDNAISNAFSNVNAIESHNAQGTTPDKVKEKLGKLSADQAAQVGNRAVTWGLPGAGAGAVVGGAIGFFAGKNSPLGAGKSAAIGAAVGTAVVGGISALVGHSKDQKFKQNASELQIIGEKVTTYSTKDASRKLEGAASQTYGVMVNANGDQSISTAIGITENVKGIKVGVNQVQSESAEVLRAYQGTTSKEVLGK